MQNIIKFQVLFDSWYYDTPLIVSSVNGGDNKDNYLLQLNINER